MKNVSVYRPSSYNIVVKLKDSASQFMLIHGYTGAIDIANENVAALLRPGSRVSIDNGLVSESTFNMLIQRGYLTQKTAQEERDVCVRWANFMHAWKKYFSLRAFMFVVSYDCNFRCPYCYESMISNKGSQWTQKTFTKEMVDRAYEAMLEIEPDRNKHQKKITLYGGEPLLAKNREIVEYIVKRGVELGYKFDAISNGYEIQYYKDLFGEGKIETIQISVDGPREIHDKRRYHYKDGGTFDKIVENIGLALDAGVTINLRANTDATNWEYIESLYEQFKAVGYVGNPHFNFNAALVIGDENIRPNHGPRSKKQFEPPHLLLTKADFNAKLLQTDVPGQHQDQWIFKKLYTAIKYNTRINFSPIYCAVQSSSYILDPIGDIYNCWETIGKERHIIGHYLNGITWEDEIKHWHNRNVGTTPRCSTCKYMFLCGGGCVAKVLRAYDDFSESYCYDFPNLLHNVANTAFQAYMHQQSCKKDHNCHRKEESVHQIA